MGYGKDGEYTVGNLIQIYSNGNFDVGEAYLGGNGELENRGTWYSTDGTSDDYGDHSLQVESVATNL